MADAVTARWHGDNYQARVFWQNALHLLDEVSCIVEVTFEANGPKSFDDVVVRYDPAIPVSGSQRISADYHQVKWHVTTAGRFGYADLIDPKFIGAETFSILERLRDAKVKAGHPARFTFLTTYRIADGDPLAELIAGVDHTVLVERLFDGTKTDTSKMGKVRKLWREHLGVSNDELRAIVEGLRIEEGYPSLEQLRADINFRATAVGVLACSRADSDFRFDELARQLKIRSLNGLDKARLLQLCADEGLFSGKRAARSDFHPIAVRSFLGPAADVSGALPDDTLVLTDKFRQRYLQDGQEWQRDIRPEVEAFLRETIKRHPKIQLILDAHASIALLAGAVYDLKSGVAIELVQKGMRGPRVWTADDGTSKDAPRLTIQNETIKPEGEDVAVCISIARNTRDQALAYCGANLPSVGTLMHFAFPEGPGQRAVLGGEHAAALADQIANAVREACVANIDATVHIFAACPNSLLFYLGQQHQSIAPFLVYEFDFDRKGDRTYQPSFLID